MLVVYLTDETVIEWVDSVPTIGDRFPDSDLPIASIEVYQGELETVLLIASQPIEHEPTESFDIQIAPDRSIIRNGWSMEGKPRTGRLVNYEPTNHETLMRAVPSRWYVDQIETCKPVEQGSYKAIYLCFCVDAPLSAAA